MNNKEYILELIRSIFAINEDSVSSLTKMLADIDEDKLITRFSQYGVKDGSFCEDIIDKANLMTALIEIILENPSMEAVDISEKKSIESILYSSTAELYEQIVINTKIDESWNNLHYLVLYSMLSYLGDRQTISDVYISKYIELLFEASLCFNRLSILKKLEYNTFYLIVKILSNIKNYEGLIQLNHSIEQTCDLLDKAQKEQLALEVMDLNGCYKIAAYGNIIYLISAIKEFLFTGKSSNSENKDINSLIDMYSYNSFQFIGTDSTELRVISHLVRYAFRKVVENSIWNIADKSPLIREFIVQNLSSKEQFYYTLLPSQRESISDVLTPKKSIVVGMPTSAGKSFIAEMQMLFSIHNYRTNDFYPTVCYVVPTNALISQVKLDLQNDFKAFGFNIETALPCYDIDEIENEFLSEKHIDILISTPEKLEALVRQNHKAISSTRLVILDEAHNIGDESRGSKFELVLSIIKQNIKEANFLLLSPFINNAKEINEWLADSPRDANTITVEWTPTKQYIGCNLLNSKKTESRIKFFKTPRNNLISNNLEIKLQLNPQAVKSELNNDTVDNSTRLCVLLNDFINQEGNTLVLCAGKGTTVKLAMSVKEYFSTRNMLPNMREDPDVQRAIETVKLENGEDDSLIECLAHGVCYHNAGLSNLVKEAIEELVRINKIKVVLATTTLAQGINFPINTVIFDTISIRNKGKLSHSEFWNIAGRAGRAYKDKEGYVIISFNNSNKDTEEIVQSYIRQDLRNVVSSLNTFFSTDNEISFDYNVLKEKENIPILNLLQYINHILNISYDYNINPRDVAKIRGILTESFLYHSLSKQEGYLVAQEKLNAFVTQYIQHVNNKNKRDLITADELGISDVSYSKIKEMINAYVHDLRKSGDRQYQVSEIILQTKNVEKLTKIIEIIARIPEIRIDMKGQGYFDAESIAKLLLGWVNGASVREIAEGIRRPDQSTSEIMALCNQYLNSQMKSYMPWGINIYQNVCYDIESQNAKMLPSYIYYGVSSKEAVIISKLGVPRFAVDVVLDKIKTKHKNLSIDIAHMSEIKAAIGQLSQADYNIKNSSGSIIKEIVDKRLQ